MTQFNEGRQTSLADGNVGGKQRQLINIPNNNKPDGTKGGERRELGESELRTSGRNFGAAG